MDIIEDIRTYIVDNFLFGDGDELHYETSFLESGIIDSTGILELITFLEETCHIKVEDEELIPENLDSLEKIHDFLARKMGPDAQARQPAL